MHSSMNFYEANVYACKQPIKKQNMTGTPELAGGVCQSVPEG